MKALGISFLILLAGCGSLRAGAPDIQTRKEVITVPVPCTAPNPQKPDMPDTKSALSIDDIYRQTQLLLAGRMLRDAYIEALEDQVKTCKSLPAP